MADNRLTDKQRKFADCYMLTGDRLEALKAGGYTLNNPSVLGSQLVRNARIKDYIEERSKTLIASNIDEITALVKGLDKKEAACLEIWKCYEAIKDAKNPTKYKWFELLCKLKGHFNENTTQNLFVTSEGKNLSVMDIMEGTGKLTGVLRELRFEAEIMRKSKFQNMSTSHEIPEVIDITPVTYNQEQ